MSETRYAYRCLAMQNDRQTAHTMWAMYRKLCERDCSTTQTIGRKADCKLMHRWLKRGMDTETDVKLPKK
jgi:hypothetical protein